MFRRNTLLFIHDGKIGRAEKKVCVGKQLRLKANQWELRSFWKKIC